MVVFARFHTKEVEHAVLARSSAGNQRSPGRRSQRGNDGSQPGAGATLKKGLEEGHVPLLDQRIEDLKRGSVQTDQQCARLTHCERPADDRVTSARFLSTKSTSPPMERS